MPQTLFNSHTSCFQTESPWQPDDAFGLWWHLDWPSGVLSKAKFIFDIGSGMDDFCDLFLPL